MGGSRGISILLRLAPQAIAAGRLAGRAEIVETGETVQIRSGEELVEFLRTNQPPETKGPAAAVTRGGVET